MYPLARVVSQFIRVIGYLFALASAFLFLATLLGIGSLTTIEPNIFSVMFLGLGSAYGLLFAFGFMLQAAFTLAIAEALTMLADIAENSDESTELLRQMRRRSAQ